MHLYAISIELKVHDREGNVTETKHITEYWFESRKEARHFAYRIGDLLP